MAILKQHAQEHHNQSGHRADSHREKLELLGFHTSSVPVLAVGVKVSASFFSLYPPTSRGSSPPNARAFPRRIYPPTGSFPSPLPLHLLPRHNHTPSGRRFAYLRSFSLAILALGCDGRSGA